MKALALLFTIFTLISSQAFGASLCPSICDNSQNIQVTQSEAPPCHQIKSEKKSSSDMPEDCGVMVLLKVLTTYDLNASTLGIDKEVYSGHLNFTSLIALVSYTPNSYLKFLIPLATSLILKIKDLYFY